MKVCTKCKEPKPATLEFFHKHKNGLRPNCKNCSTSYHKSYREINKDKISNSKKLSYASSRDEVLARVKKYSNANKDKISARNARYYQTNKAKIDHQHAEYCNSNKSRILNYKRVYFHKKVRSDIDFKISQLMSSRIWKAVKQYGKSARILDLLGCSIDYLKVHLSKQFKPGMSWENYGEWHIDHIRPCSTFDLSDPEQQKCCFNYSNLQPLWAEENLSKGAKWGSDEI